MGLEGSIEDFGLADILQLLYFQKKTGLLNVEGRLGRIKVYFHSGNIVAAESKKKLEDKRLGKILVKKGYISEEQLHETLEQKKSSKEKIGAILINRGLVSKENIQEIIINQLTEIVVQLFNWKKGSYEFKPQRIQIDKDLEISVDTQHLLMDGLRIVDELSVIEGKVNLDTVFKRTRKKGLDLSSEEETILGHIDGENDVSAVIEISGEDDFEVSKTLVSLLEKGAIELLEQKEFVVDTKTRERGLKIPMIAIATNFILIISFFISLSPLFIQKDNMNIIKAEKDLQKIRLVVEMEKFSMGSFPESLQSVITINNDPWNNKYSYRLTESGYDLRSPGPDGVPNTSDDIY
jgi:hypothetical protein